MIRNAEERASKAANNLWYLDIPIKHGKMHPFYRDSLR